jgi:hypothetical protein
MPAQKTGNADEFVINRDDKGPFGNLAGVKKSVAADAANFCESMGKKAVEKYSIDKDRAVLVWPETTLYFECKSVGEATTAPSAQDRKAEVPRPSTMYDELLKLDELRKKGIISEAEFESEKKKALGTK